MQSREFEALVNRLADSWAALDAKKASDCFTDDAIYMEPPDQQLFVGRDQLEAYFSPLEPGTYLRFHNVSFNEATQTGATEFSFAVAGGDTADHGVAVIEVRDGRIAFWREYLRSGPADFETFIGTQDKTWEWHIGNYP